MNVFRKLSGRLFDTADDFRLLIFIVLAVCGSVISLTTTVTSLLMHAGPVSVGINSASFLISVALLLYTRKTRNYRVGYLVTVIVIFWILFPILFFSGGGIHSGMPSFFVFAVVFSVYMLRGFAGAAAGIFEILLYSFCCVAAVRHPELVTPFATENKVLFDVILCFAASSAALGITMMIQFRIYMNQQKKAEAAAADAELQSRAKGIFLASMSHEIRTPINIILSNSEMIGRYSSDDQILELNRSIETSGEYLLSLISNVLDITKIESGKMDVTNVSYSLASLASELELIGQELSARKGLSFRMVRSFDPSVMLYGDRNHLRQIAANLIGNAVKYTPSGMVSVTVSHTPGQDDPDILFISVTDTGIGIDASELDSIFDTFTRVAASGTGPEGSGLGLSIVKQLTELLNGKISVTSEPGKGSCFSVEIPQQPCLKEDAADYRDVDYREFVAPEGRILAVDDNEENLKILRLLLEKLLVRIDTASGGREGLELARKNHYDIIILDYMMPEMDGVATLQAMKEAGVESAYIVLTANAVAGTEGKLLEAGFSCYISKPVRSRELEQKILTYLPEEKVSFVSEKASLPADAANLSDLREIVSGLDVDVESGLKLVHNNLEKYGSICGLYAESHDYYRAEADRFFGSGNWENLTYTIHSLKSRALGIGALRLGSTSRILEQKLRQKDADYVKASYPLLCLEWTRSAKAARLIAGYVQRLSVSSGNTVPGEENSSLLAAAKAAVAENMWIDACEYLKKLSAADPARREIYESAFAAADELNFDRAEELLNQI